MFDLRETLRASTALSHRALEATPLMRIFVSGGISPQHYRQYLGAQGVLHEAMEPALRPWLDADCAALRLVKADWLRQDLEALGIRPRRQAIDWRAPATRAEALGALYVLEGATLGLRSVLKGLPADHPALGAAGRFVTGYGDRTGGHWKAFVALLGQVGPHEWPQATAGASAAFRAFHDVFSACQVEAVELQDGD
jgi:heme oxygenase